MDDLRKRSLSEGEKRKLELYFRELASEMEKYYIAAKNLHKIEDKAIKF
jgi:predicted DNA-binding antitoxin AbrB/MazE fold protein